MPSVFPEMVPEPRAVPETPELELETEPIRVPAAAPHEAVEPPAAPVEEAARPVSAPAAEPAQADGPGLSDDEVERIAQRVASLVADTVLREVAWEVIPDLAEVVIKERIRELESQVE